MLRELKFGHGDQNTPLGLVWHGRLCLIDQGYTITDGIFRGKWVPRGCLGTAAPYPVVIWRQRKKGTGKLGKSWKVHRKMCAS
jgi:hypothetical protein